MASNVNTGYTNSFVRTHGETQFLSKVETSTGQSPDSLEIIVQGQHPNKGPNLGHSVGFFTFFFGNFFTPPRIHLTTLWPDYKSRHTMAPSHSGFFLFYHYNLQGSCLRTVIQPLAETAGLLISWVFSFLPRTITTSTDQQGGVSFQTTPMGKITHTHSPRTGVESSTTYLRVQICEYSPRTGIRSKCLQNPWGMEPNHLRRLQDTEGFFFFTTTNRQIPTGTTSVGFFFFTTTNQQIPTGTTYTGLIFPRP